MTTLFGDIRRVTGGFELQFQRIFATDVQDLWSAVTDPDRLARWMSRYDGDLILGGSWRTFLDDGGEYAVGTVIECDAPNGFVTTWQATDEGETTLRVSIDVVPGGARLRLVHEGVQSIYYGAGWQTYLEQLDDLLGAAAASVVDPDRERGVSWDDRFTALRVPWEQRFGSLRDVPSS